MALVHFSDDENVGWKVWDVTRDRPMGFGATIREGWLCFESDTGIRRRLSPFPDDWESSTREQLIALRDRAAPGTSRTTEHMPYVSETQMKR